MELKGTIIQALPEVSGIAKSTGNPWKKREYVMEYNDNNSQYPKKLYFSFFGDRADQFPLAVGQKATVSFDLDSREYNGRWYVEVRAWKAEVEQAAAPAATQAAAPGSIPPPPVVPQGADEEFPF